MSQKITILRRTGSWQYGTWVQSDQPETLTMRGIVTMASAKDLQQVPEGDRLTGSIKILTTERIFITDGSGHDTTDMVFWRGARYRVVTVTPDIDYGFYRSIGTRLDGDGIG
jgi:hypothetical protein